MLNHRRKEEYITMSDLELYQQSLSEQPNSIEVKIEELEKKIKILEERVAELEKE